MERLRGAGIQPTSVRIAVLQVIDAAYPASLDADAAFRRLDARGVCVSPGSVYRVLRELHAAHLLVREWGLQRRALYRASPMGKDILALHLLCPDSGRRVALEDEALLAALRVAAGRLGVALDGHCLVIAAEAGAQVKADVPRQGLRRAVTGADTGAGTGLHDAAHV